MGRKHGYKRTRITKKYIRVLLYPCLRPFYFALLFRTTGYIWIYSSARYNIFKPPGTIGGRSTGLAKPLLAPASFPVQKSVAEEVRSRVGPFDRPVGQIRLKRVRR